MASKVLDASKRLAVAQAVNDMTAAKPFADIQVGEICEAVDISRSSFYRLFEDKYGIARWCHFLAFRAGICEIGRTLNVRQGNEVTLSGVRMFGGILSGAARERGSNTFYSLITNRHRDSMRETLSDYLHEDIDDELSFQIDMTAESQAVMVALWIDGAYGYEADHFAELMVSCLPRRLFSLLDEPVGPKPAIDVTPASLVKFAIVHS